MKSRIHFSKGQEPKLFGPREDWWHNACVNYEPDGWDLYAWGYKRAAEVLVKHVKENRGDLDGIIYPLIFNYRHYIELRLKLLIRDGSVLFDESRELPQTHNLEYLWEHTSRVLKETWPDEDDSDLEKIKKLIDEFTFIDPYATSFRYPVETQGNQSLPENLTHINIAQLWEQLDFLTIMLEGATCAIAEYVSWKYEMESEYGGP